MMKHGNWYNEEYMENKRREVVETARGLMDGRIDFLSGVRRLRSLKYVVSDDEFDPDFSYFVAIDSEVDHIPSGEARGLYSESWLKKCDAELQRLGEATKVQMVEACTNLISRFDTDESPL